MNEEQKQLETIIENNTAEDVWDSQPQENSVVEATTPETLKETDSQNQPPAVSESETEGTSEPTTSELELVIETLQLENASIKSKLEAQLQQTEQLKAQFVRNAADFENFRKRTEKEKEELEYQVKRKTLAELLSVIDNFERARNQIKPTTEGETTIHKSYQGVYRLLVDSLKRLGVSAMKPETQPFDPNFHEAVMQYPTNEIPEGHVVEQLQRGYLLGDRVLRHAMVKVAIPAEEEEVSSSAQSTKPPLTEETVSENQD